jgi:insulysin
MCKITIHLTPEGFCTLFCPAEGKPNNMEFLLANYRSVVLAAYKYLALLRSSKFETFHHEELVQLSHTRFRSLIKEPPDDYETWLTEHMAWLVPHYLLLAGPRLIWAWENDPLTEDY